MKYLTKALGDSNFHKHVINNLRAMGFAKQKHGYLETLNQNEDPKYRMRCGMRISQF